MMNSVIFREYDIRGIYNQDFDKNFAFLLGRAFVAYVCKNSGVSNPRLTLGHDARLSSPEITQALCDGMKASGAHVILLGLVTSPISYFSTFSVSQVLGGIMVTGSHNPPNYNGFKISFGRSHEEMSTIFGAEIKKLEQIILAEEFLTGQGSEEAIDILTPYVERYKSEFANLSPIPVVLDCGNGAAGKIARRLYEAVGLKPTILFEQPDGRFPNHHPDPTVEKNLEDLKRAVLEQKAQVGIGFDGDADRIGVVDEQGKFILGDELMTLIGLDILRSQADAKIIGDVKCSDRFYNLIKQKGGRPIMWKTGHSLIKEKVKIEKAPFGGEMSGHVFFRDRNYGYDDALYAGLRLVETLSKSRKPISEWLKELPPSFCTPEIRIDTTEEIKHQAVERLQSYFQHQAKGIELNQIDGIRVSYPDGWALARASNTQPVLVLRFESTNKPGLDRIQSEFKSVIGDLLDLPF